MLNFKYGAVTRDKDRDAFEEAQTTAQAQQDAGYKSPWEEQLKGAMDKILNREEFNYDLNGDAFYNQYKDKYTRQGQQAMMDTVGQQAALTGGFGNSWAQTAGQQVYQGHLEELNDIVPQLYQLALDKYNAEGEELYNQYALLGDMDDKEFQKYQDKEALKKWLATQDEDVRNYYLTYGKMPNEEDYETDSPFGDKNYGGGSSGGSGKGSSSKGSSGGTSLYDVAMAVIRGDYGNGDARKKALAAAGYDPAEVQAAVNKLIAGGAPGGGGNGGSSGYTYEEMKKAIDENLAKGEGFYDDMIEDLKWAYENKQLSEEDFMRLCKEYGIKKAYHPTASLK